MRPTIYTITHDGPGTISTMAKPRPGEWLDDEMAGLRSLAVDVVVCLLTAAELRELDLNEEQDAAYRAGLDFVWLPVADRGVPDAVTFRPVLDDLVQRLGSGHHVVAHCRFGIGRASLLAAALLTATGCDPGQAWDRISAARGYDVPDTDDQRNWVYQHIPTGQARGRVDRQQEIPRHASLADVKPVTGSGATALDRVG